MALKTSGNIVTDLYKLIKNSSIPTTVTPNIFKKFKPLNFSGECIVINTLPITGGQLQKGVINVNYFVPNLVNTSVNPVDKTQPNNVRLDAGELILAQFLEDIWEMNGYAFSLQQCTQMADNETDSWYVNLRVGYINGN